MKEGHDHPPCCPLKLKVASTLEVELRSSAVPCRPALELQDADYVVALTLELGKTKELVGKTLDLSKAYKQLPILPSHRDLAVVFFRDSRGDARYCIPNALRFGSTAAVYAVYAFNRMSRSLWFLINVFLKVPASVYFDDYPMFLPEASAQETDTLVSDFFDLLGWRHDRTGPKGKPFASAFDVLVLTLDLSGLRNSDSVTLKQRREGQDLIKTAQGQRDWGHEPSRGTRNTWPLEFRNRILRWQIFEIRLFQNLFLGR